MRRTNMCHKINRNSDTNIYDINTNPVFVNMLDPEFLENQNWQRYDVARGVDIIEIKDSDLSESSDDTPRQNINHAWCYVNNATQPLEEEQNKYSMNKKARDRRRLRADSPQNFDLDDIEYTNNNTLYYDNIDMSNHQSKNNVRLNHQINCFTIINKHFVDSDTSSENSDYYNKQKQSMGDTLIENEDYYSILEDEMLTYNSDFDAEKKTIWIYSFKNKHLTDDCFELVNIPSKDTESLTTFCFDKLEDPSHITRAASPIPPPYIPRLDLSLGQTLSTVTEVTEPNKQSSLETERSIKGPVKQKPKNSWLLNKYRDRTEIVNKQEKSTNIINWMALSPRERRRISREKHSDSDVDYTGKLATLQKVYPKEDLKTDIQGKCEIIKTQKDSQSTIVDIDIHVGLHDSKEKNICPNKDSAKFIPDANVLDVIEKDNLDDVKIDEVTIQEVNLCPRKPQININPKRVINMRSVSDPIEKLNSDDWILEEGEQPTSIYSYDLDRSDEVNVTKREREFTANDRLWSKNALALMKPAQWTEYAPIGDSHLSLHLSLNSSFEKQTCFTKLINLFKCCK